MGVSTRKQRETDALREKVLDTAEDIFIREGIGQVTMRRIAASIDYAPTVLYRLFTNKADLTDHLIARGYRGVRDQYIDVLKKKNPSPKAQLEDILAVYVDYALTHPNHYRMWFDTGSIRLEDEHLHMTHGRLQFLVYQNWLDSIEACQSDGLFAGWELLDVFQILWSRVHGLISLRLQHPDLPWMPVEQHLQGVLELGIKASRQTL
jgi:AcrR family transcriptional regulator